MPTVRFSLYSPRWGHQDEYEIRMEEDRLEFAQGPRVATCEWRPGQDPVWGAETIPGILHNDSIYPPDALVGLVEWAWTEWRNNRLITEAELQREFELIAEWVNTTTRAKPRTEFWRRYF